MVRRLAAAFGGGPHRYRRPSRADLRQRRERLGVATKVRLGRLPKAAIVVARLGEFLAEQGFAPLPVTLEDGRRAGLLPGPHGDPFDRMLIAQTLARELTLVSCEAPLDAYGVARLW